MLNRWMERVRAARGGGAAAMRAFRAFRAFAGVAVLLAATPEVPRAHEIPARVGILAFIKPEGHRLHVLLRLPLEAMRDVQYVTHPDGTLDLARTAPLLAVAARTWIGDYLEMFEEGARLTADPDAITQISEASDRSFVDYATAARHVEGAMLPATTEVRWQQGLIDVELTYPITSDSAHFSMRPTLAHLGVRTTTVLRFLPPGGSERVFEYAGNPGLVALDPRWHQAALRFVALGFEHILSGLDHLLFVLCLVIPVRRWRALLQIVTAFTVAHSITLVGSAFGLAPSALWFPPLVEMLIAMSIVWMALENILRPGDQLGHRWQMAFGFGLVHGFGFSFALRESLQFGGSHVVTSLAAFNVGVELGQILVLAVAVPVLAWFLTRVVAERMGVMVLSALVCHEAWHWMTARGSQLAQYDFSAPTLDSVFWLGVVRGLLLLAIATAARWLFALVSRRFEARVVVRDAS